MIVVDANVLAYLLIPGKYTNSAERLLEADPEWAAPTLWRSELRNVLATYVRAGQLKLADAAALYRRASDILGPDQYEVETLDVLRLSRGRCPATC
jgi:predicted nucleic acid-binding protein